MRLGWSRFRTVDNIGFRAVDETEKKKDRHGFL